MRVLKRIWPLILMIMAIIGCVIVSASAFKEDEPRVEYVEKIKYVEKRVVEPEPVVIYQVIEKEKIVEVEVEVEKVVEVYVPSEPIDYTVDDLYCMAAVIYQEAGGDECTDEVRVKVADVVLNRKNSSSFPNTIREVLEAPRQYGKFGKYGVYIPNRGDSEIETRAIARAWYLAAKVLGGYHSELYGNGYVFQAEFPQGEDVIFECDTYFGR